MTIFCNCINAQLNTSIVSDDTIIINDDFIRQNEIAEIKFNRFLTNDQKEGLNLYKENIFSEKWRCNFIEGKVTKIEREFSGIDSLGVDHFRSDSGGFDIYPFPEIFDFIYSAEEKISFINISGNSGINGIQYLYSNNGGIRKKNFYCTNNPEIPEELFYTIEYDEQGNFRMDSIVEESDLKYSQYTGEILDGREQSKKVELSDFTASHFGNVSKNDLQINGFPVSSDNWIHLFGKAKALIIHPCSECTYIISFKD